MHKSAGYGSLNIITIEDSNYKKWQVACSTPVGKPVTHDPLHYWMGRMIDNSRLIEEGQCSAENAVHNKVGLENGRAVNKGVSTSR